MMSSPTFSFDSYKDEGILFPSSKKQTELLRDFYADLRLDPRTVTYVEAHGTGKFDQLGCLFIFFKPIIV